jgi:hypothetical protein
MAQFNDGLMKALKPQAKTKQLMAVMKNFQAQSKPLLALG